MITTPGDIVFLATERPGAGLLRRVTRCPYDHVAVLIGGWGAFVHVWEGKILLGNMGGYVEEWARVVSPPLPPDGHATLARSAKLEIGGTYTPIERVLALVHAVTSGRVNSVTGDVTAPGFVALALNQAGFVPELVPANLTVRTLLWTLTGETP